MKQLDQTEKPYQRPIPISCRIFSFDNVAKKYTMPIAPFHGKLQCIDPHVHQDIEMITVIKGTLYMTLDKVPVTVRESETIVINSFVVHEGYALTDEPFVQYSFCRFNLHYFNMPQFNRFNSLVNGIANGIYRFPVRISDSNGYDCQAIIQHLISMSETLHILEKNDFAPEQICRLYSSFFAFLSLLIPYVYTEKSLLFTEVHNDFINKVSYFLETNYMKPITPNDIANSLSYSKSNFYRLFRKCYQTNPTAYICRYRVMRAASEFRNVNLPLQQIALAVGFPSYCYFSRVFKEHIGIPPKKYFDHQEKDT